MCKTWLYQWHCIFTVFRRQDLCHWLIRSFGRTEYIRNTRRDNGLQKVLFFQPGARTAEAFGQAGAQQRNVSRQ